MAASVVFTFFMFILAIGGFLIQDYVTGTVTDVMIDVNANVIKQSPIDDTSKQAILPVIYSLKIVGIVGTLIGLYAIYQEYFG